MGEGQILDPFAPGDPVGSALDRITRLEQRPRVNPPRATLVRPVAAGFGGFWSMSIASGAGFVDAYAGVFDSVSHLGLFARGGLAVDVGTTGAVRVTATPAVGPPVTSAVQALAASATPALGWIHGVPLGPGVVTCTWQVRNDGPGNIAAFLPVMMQLDPTGSSPAGAWYPSGWLPWP